MEGSTLPRHLRIRIPLERKFGPFREVVRYLCRARKLAEKQRVALFELAAMLDEHKARVSNFRPDVSHQSKKKQTVSQRNHEQTIIGPRR